MGLDITAHMLWPFFALAFIAGLIVGRLSRRPAVRHSSGAYFLKRREAMPYLAHWSQDVADHIRSQRAK